MRVATAIYVLDIGRSDLALVGLVGHDHGIDAFAPGAASRCLTARERVARTMVVILDPQGEEFGIGRSYLNRDPPHVAPIDGKRMCRSPRRAQRATLEMDCLTGKIVEREKRLAHLKKAFQDGRGSESPSEHLERL